jgi:glycosyltransferase involved in cell wall biosynthesis
MIAAPDRARSGPARPRLRILVLNWLDPLNPRAGGAEKHLAELFGRLAAWGHRVTLIASGFRGGARVAHCDGIAIVRVGGPLSFPLPARRLLARLTRRRRFDLVVEDLNKVPLYPERIASAPLVVLVHHLWGRVAFSAAAPPIALVTWAAERLLRSRYPSARFVAVSPSTGRELIDRGIARERIEVIQNAADRPGARGANRAPVPTFLYLGRLQRYKGVRHLIEAAAVLAREGRRFGVWIAGAGPERRRLETLTRRLGLGAIVRFLGPVPEVQKPTLYARAWANVLMSEKEGWGLTVLEAALEGTPSVVAFAPGLWDAVRHLETGLWIPYHELPTLADGLRYLLDNPDAVERMGAAARERAGARDWDQAARELEQALRRAARVRR